MKSELLPWQLRSDGRRLARNGELLHLARGHVFRHSQPSLREGTKGRKTLIYAEDPGSGRSSIIYPRFEQQFRIGGEHFLMFAAVTKGEISEALALIASIHREGPPRIGMILAIRALNRNNKPIVAAAVAAEIYYTMLRERDAFAGASLGDDWYARFEAGVLSRADVVRQTAIVCATRFAVRADARRIGLSEKLANGLAQACAAYRWPPANYIEVVRWMDTSKYAELCLRLKNDFLTCSGYVPEPLHGWRNTKHDVKDILRSLTTDPRPVRGYYWRDVTSLQLRQFGRK